MGLKFGAITHFDAFARAEDHLTQKTKTGAVVTLLGVLTMSILFVHELGFYLQTYKVHKMAVDSTEMHTRLDIVVNITFPALPCQVLSLDALDMSGKHEVDLHTTIFKETLDKEGRRIGRELVRDLVEKEHENGHGKPPSDDPKSEGNEFDRAFIAMQQESDRKAAEIKSALDRSEGCLVHGHLLVQRVAGNFHVSVHGHNYYLLKKVFGSVSEVNVSHHIHRLGFGMEYPGQVNPLDGFDRILKPGTQEAGGTFKYFLKIVPTEYKSLKGKSIVTNQYSVTEYFTPNYKNEHSLPAVYFMYDLSPITVTISENRRNFFHFLTRLCAVLGGTFALSGMLDKWVELILKQVMQSLKT